MRVRLPSSARQAKEGRCQRSCWRQQKVTCGATAAVTQPLQSAVGARRRALVMRIQRALPAGERLRKSREGSRSQAELGDYFIVRNNTVAAWHVQLDKLARKLGCMAAFERLED
jgi:hypothetical protein